MFWPPPRHNKQRDPRKRSDSCYLVYHLSFKQKTSLFDTAFSRRVASKLGILRPSVTLFMRMFKLEHRSSNIKIKHSLRSILFIIMLIIMFIITFIIMFIIHHLHHHLRRHRWRQGHLPLQPLRQLFQRLNTHLSNLIGRTCLNGL
jgi:hypothetical protein